MGLFKEIICDRSLDGAPLPDNILVIAACNPYRLRVSKARCCGEEMAGLLFEYSAQQSGVSNIASGISDPLRNLVYRVHPLPESMIDHIYDFGALSSSTERLYIKSMLKNHLQKLCRESILEMQNGKWESPIQEFHEVFSELICTAQECVRELNDGERSSTSLRDVSRCITVFIWFGEHLSRTVGVHEQWDIGDFFSLNPSSCSTVEAVEVTRRVQRAVRRAVISSLGYCYHSRLPREERGVLVETLTKRWRSLQFVAKTKKRFGIMNFDDILRKHSKCTWLSLDPHSFSKVLEDTQLEFVSAMKLGKGIALNEALCENLFMILCSILNKIPIFIVGKPGSSKSLAMRLIQSNLNGNASENAFFKTLPAVEVFSYQCSPLSTSQGVEQTFENARRYRHQSENTLVVVLLDEVGLAEQSPHLPLKVLHKVLDEAGGNEAVVGISNWSLDPAKMNRAVHLYRPSPTVEDLSFTAEGMVQSANLKGYLRELARAYNEVYHGQDKADFWGLRDFYSTVKSINGSLKKTEHGPSSVATHVSAAVLSGHEVLLALLRNFGGRPSEMQRILSTFFFRLGMSIPTKALCVDKQTKMHANGDFADPSSSSIVGMDWNDIPVESLIRANLLEPLNARHLMLLTHNNIALSLLLDRRVLQQQSIEIIYGSDFPLDQSDLQICLNIQKIKLCMAEGITVVLVNCESLFESLYDLLNQHYVECGGQIYVRLAMGSNTKLCPLHKSFRIIVVVEKDDAYNKLSPPLLNRFEKHVLEWPDVIFDRHKALLERVTCFATSIATLGNASEVSGPSKSRHLRAAFCGYHFDMFSSLVSIVYSGLGETSICNANDLFVECARRLLWITTPETICSMKQNDQGLSMLMQEYEIGNPVVEYFQHQCHSSLNMFLNRMVVDWRDSFGSQIQILTYAAPTQDTFRVIKNQDKFHTTHIILHELDQEQQLIAAVSRFFEGAHKDSLLLVQCDASATSVRRIQLTKFIIESHRSKKAACSTVVSPNSSKSDTSLKKRSRSEVYDHDDDESCKGSAGSSCEDRCIHVVLLIHLPRPDESIVSSLFDYSLDFDTRWRVAFLDCIQSKFYGLPSVETIVDRPLSSLLLSGQVCVKQLLSDTCRSSLAKLYCRFDRSNSDLTRQIEEVTRCLQHDDFVSICHDALQLLLKHDADISEGQSSAYDISSRNIGIRDMQLAGSFQGAVHKRIRDNVVYLFALVLSHMNRNSTLSLYFDPSSPSTYVANQALVWKYLFTQSFSPSMLKNCSVSSHEKSSANQLSALASIELKSDNFGNSGSFCSRFSYSFYLIPLLENFRNVSANQGRSFGESQLQAHIRTLFLEHMDHLTKEDPDECKNVGSAKISMPMQNFIFDLTCMRCKPVPGLSREKQSLIVQQLLLNACIYSTTRGFASCFSISNDQDSDRLTFLHQVLYRYWAIESALRVYFEIISLLVSLNPDKTMLIDDCFRFLSSVQPQGEMVLKEGLPDSIHRNFLDLILGLINPLSAIWHVAVGPSEPGSSFAFKSWGQLQCSVRSSFFSLLNLIEDDAAKISLELTYCHLQFFHSFLQDVAWPFSLSFDQTLRFMMRFQACDYDGDCSNGDAMLVSSKALHQILSGLAEIGIDLCCNDCDCAIPDEFLCPLSYEVMTDPVTAGDGHTYQREAIVEWLAMEHGISPIESSLSFNLCGEDLVPNTELKTRISNWLSDVDLSAFLEHYLLEVVFLPLHRGFLQEDFIEGLIRVISGNIEIKSIKSASQHLSAVITSMVPKKHVVRGVLKELLVLQAGACDSEAAKRHGHMLSTCINSCLDNELKLVVLEKGYLDSEFCVIYVNVAEQNISQLCGGTAAHETIKQMLQSSFAHILETNSVRKFLNTIVYLRHLLSICANRLCTITDDDVEEDDGWNQLLVQVNDVLDDCAFDPSECHRLPMMHSMRMFFLKIVTMNRGLSFLRQLLLTPPLSSVSWVRSWRDGTGAVAECKNVDTNGFSRFLGSDLLPRQNPFVSLPLYQVVSQHVVTSIQTGIVDELDKMFMCFGPACLKQLKYLAGILLLALFSEVGLQSILPAEAVQSQLQSRANMIEDWLLGQNGESSKTPTLAFLSETERKCLVYFGLGRFSSYAKTSKAPPRKYFASFRDFVLTPNSSLSTILTARLHAHLAAVSIMTPLTHPMHFFRTVCFHPNELVPDSDNQQSFFPTMPEDTVKMAQTVLGGRWYACPYGEE